MAPNQGVENDAISLDEEELRRLLEQPAPDDDADGSDEAAESGSDAAASGAVDAGLPDVGPDRGSTATGAAVTGSSAALVEQDTIDQLLAKARATPPAPASHSASGQAVGSGATAKAAPAPAKRAITRPAPAPSQPKAPVTVQPVQFSPFGATPGRRDRNLLSDLGILLDVPLHVTVELGRAEMPVREILALGPGSVIELDRSAGEVLDVLANGTLIAQGEVVVVDEQFGIRLTQVYSPNRDILEGLGDD
jgi:flagellar motor switch protein FliN